MMMMGEGPACVCQEEIKKQRAAARQARQAHDQLLGLLAELEAECATAKAEVADLQRRLLGRGRADESGIEEGEALEDNDEEAAAPGTPVRRESRLQERAEELSSDNALLREQVEQLTQEVARLAPQAARVPALCREKEQLEDALARVYGELEAERKQHRAKVDELQMRAGSLAHLLADTQDAWALAAMPPSALGVSPDPSARAGIGSLFDELTASPDGEQAEAEEEEPQQPQQQQQQQHTPTILADETSGAHELAQVRLTQRRNLVWACQQAVRELIESSVLDDAQAVRSDALDRFCDTFECVLSFGLKDRRAWYSGERLGFWEFLRTALSEPAHRASVRSINQLDTVRTSLGKGRAFVRMALVEKALAEYFRAACTARGEVVARFYEPHAIIGRPEAELIWGQLTALGNVDFALCLKDTYLDARATPVPAFAHYATAPRRRVPLPDDLAASSSPASSPTPSRGSAERLRLATPPMGNLLDALHHNK